ncbi:MULTISPECIES: zinc-binding dehydrogenase [unclassified Ornithinimicrobium]|uniref:zinc-dependent alcohol dehydrogenase n=1 Tax=unclassified Ornithinimicrobium TaxID=2615080 RepID=UPI00385239A7
MPRPTAGPGEAVVRVTSAGVCGSDISALHGTHPFRKPPLISGHEVGGVIEEIGPDAPEPLKVGARVVIDPQWPCQTCELCVRGDYHLCTDKTMLGVPTWPGGLADLVKVPTFTLVPAPDSLDSSLLSFAEPVAVAVHAVRRAGQLGGVRKALVLGGGTIGTLITAVLSTQAPHLDITVAEPRRPLHDLLSTAGATTTVEDAEQLPGSTYDLVFLAAGVPSLVGTAVKSAATGGTVVQVAVFGSAHPTPIGDLQIREITMTGTATYTKDDIAAALQVIEAKPDLVQRMVTFTEDWTDAARLITKFAAEGPGDVMKLIVRRSAEQ